MLVWTIVKVLGTAVAAVILGSALDALLRVDREDDDDDDLDDGGVRVPDGPHPMGPTLGRPVPFEYREKVLT